MKTLSGSSRTPASILSLLAVLALGASAQASQGDKTKYSDEKFAFSMTVGEPWKSAPLQGFAVPGVARAAWMRNGPASIVAFIQEPGQAFSPRFLVDESAKGLKQALDAKILAQEVKTVAGKQAMWLVFEAKGTGGGFAGKRDVDTTQHWVAIPREKDVVIILLTSPSADYEANKKLFEKVVKSLEVSGTQTKEQQDAK